MTGHAFELPLAFDGHTAHLVVTPLAHGWLVRTGVATVACSDGNNSPSEFSSIASGARMQQWLTQAETNERRLASAA